MVRNNEYNIFQLNKIGYSIIMVGCIISMIVQLSFVNFPKFADTWSYYYALDCLLTGRIDVFRTPMYPLVLGLCHLPFKGDAVSNIPVAMLQWAFFIISVRLLGGICVRFLSDKCVSFWITLFYAWWPGVTLCNNVEMTESLAVSGVVFFMYFVSGVVYENRIRYVVGMIVTVLCLIMLRPIFLYLIVVCIVIASVLAFIGYRRYKKVVWMCSLGCVLCIGVVGLYINEMKRLYSINSISYVTTYNNFFLLMETTPPSNDYVGNDSLRSEIKTFIESGEGNSQEIWNKMYYLEDKYGKSRMSIEVAQEMAMNQGEVLIHIMKRFVDAAIAPMFFNMDVWTFLDAVTPPIWGLYMIGVLSSLLMVYVMRRVRPYSTLYMIFWMLFMANLVIGVAGAQSEWGRLTLPSVAPMLIMVGYICIFVKHRRALIH